MIAKRRIDGEEKWPGFPGLRKDIQQWIIRWVDYNRRAMASDGPDTANPPNLATKSPAEHLSVALESHYGIIATTERSIKFIDCAQRRLDKRKPRSKNAPPTALEKLREKGVI